MQDREIYLNRICFHCGEYYGLHRASDSACPLRDFWEPKRMAGYSKQSKFGEWEECQE